MIVDKATYTKITKLLWPLGLHLQIKFSGDTCDIQEISIGDLEKLLEQADGLESLKQLQLKHDRLLDDMKKIKAYEKLLSKKGIGFDGHINEIVRESIAYAEG